jgi:hypothetical protein
MRLVLATHALGLGGSETYLITLGEQLERLGHVVHLRAAGLGDGVTVAASRGIDVAPLDGDLPPCDAIVVQDGASAFELARRCPGAPLLFVAHSEEFDEQLPPLLKGVVGAVVVLNDRVERRVRALAGDVEVVRLRQPVDVRRFKPRSPPLVSARRLLLLGNNADPARLKLVESVSRQAGLTLVRLGAKGTPTHAPEDEILRADIVMGYGRCMLEAMACGRPAYVYDHLGGDGWVTAATYPELEGDGFGGRAFSAAIDRTRLLDDLRAYDPEMGIVNRDLAVKAHRAEHHAQEVVALLDRMAKPDRSGNDVDGELSRLMRAQWRLSGRISDLESVNGELHKEVAREHTEGWARYEELINTRRFRIGSVLARPLDRLRDLRRSRD